MATKAPAPAKAQPAPAAKTSGKTINRHRRNSLERKSLPRLFKTLFGGSGHVVFRSLVAAWKESRRKPSPAGREG